MEWLNYHHLLYFWVAAREGGISRASRVLRLSHPTVSGQIHALEEALGEQLFVRQGRKLVLTGMGQVVFRYADEIFSLGRELLDTVKGRPTGRPVRLVVGIADVVPKMMVRRLLQPVLHLPEPLRLVCREGKPDRLLAELAAHTLDVVLADSPIGAGGAVRAFDHLLGESEVVVLGVRALAARHRQGFPASLDGAPFVLPTDSSTLRRSLDHWFGAQGLAPRAVAEVEDSALVKVLAQDGLGLVALPSAIERAVRKQYGLELVGRLPEVIERYYAISIERKLVHPAVIAISEGARTAMLAR